MEARKILSRARIQLADTAKMLRSDWELLEALNIALNMVAELNQITGGPLFRRKATLAMESGRAALPQDFLAVDRGFSPAGEELFLVVHSDPLLGEMKLEDNGISSGESEVELRYFGRPATVESEGDEIQLPEAYAVPLGRATALIVAGEIDAAAEALAFSAARGKKRVEGKKNRKEEK